MLHKFKTGDKIRVKKPIHIDQLQWLKVDTVYEVVDAYEPKGDVGTAHLLLELKEIPGILWAYWRFERA